MTYRPTAGQRAALAVLTDWADTRLPNLSTRELADLARDVDRAIRHATRGALRRHEGLTSKPRALPDDARVIAARIEATTRPEETR